MPCPPLPTSPLYNLIPFLPSLRKSFPGLCYYFLSFLCVGFFFVFNIWKIHIEIRKETKALLSLCVCVCVCVCVCMLVASVQFSSVQLLSHVRLFATPWIAACQVPLSITNSRSSPKLLSIESVMPSSHLILCRPLLLLPPIPPSISLFQWVNSSHEVAKVLELQLQHHSLQRNLRADLL